MTKTEVDVNKGRRELTFFISKKYGIDYKTCVKEVMLALSIAFDNKYGVYKYSKDARSVEHGWKQEFKALYTQARETVGADPRTINIGVGAGNEARALFASDSDITFVDIAKSGLGVVGAQFPCSKCIVASADNLPALPSDFYDIYVSLRTYNSSFFDIGSAATEARRILKRGAQLIISVANGFLDTRQNRIVPGLLLPGTDFVDLYRGIDTAKLVRLALEEREFENVQIYPTGAEIFLSAIASLS